MNCWRQGVTSTLILAVSPSTRFCPAVLAKLTITSASVISILLRCRRAQRGASTGVAEGKDTRFEIFINIVIHRIKRDLECRIIGRNTNCPETIDISGTCRTTDAQVNGNGVSRGGGNIEIDIKQLPSVVLIKAALASSMIESPSVIVRAKFVFVPSAYIPYRHY